MEDKSTHILDTAVRLFATIGIGVATAKIAKEAGVSNGTLFNYFPTKQNLIDSCYVYTKQKIFDELLQAYDENAPLNEGINRVMKRFVYWGLKRPTEYKAISLLRFSNVLSDDAIEKVDEIFKVFNDELRDAIKEKEIIDVPVDYIGMLFGGHIEAMMAYINEKKLQGDALEEFLNMAIGIMWSAIKRD